MAGACPGSASGECRFAGRGFAQPVKRASAARSGRNGPHFDLRDGGNNVTDLVAARLRSSSRAQKALPDRAAKEPREDHEVEDDGPEQGQGWRTLELETVFGGVAGEVGDRITGSEQDEEEIEDAGQHLAPGGK